MSWLAMVGTGAGGVLILSWLIICFTAASSRRTVVEWVAASDSLFAAVSKTSSALPATIGARRSSRDPTKATSISANSASAMGDGGSQFCCRVVALGLSDVTMTA